MTVPDTFLRGKLVDENGLPPRIACFSVLAEGIFQGKRAFVRVQGDHRLETDGTFTSPSLVAGRYFLRFFGMLRGEAASANDIQRLAFDFVYPDTETVLEALPFDLKDGESIESVFRVPKPTWFTIAGHINSNLNIRDYSRVSIMFQRDMGILPDVGGIGFPAGLDGSFQGMLLKGIYSASVHETEQEPSGFTRTLRRYDAGKVVIERDTQDLLVPTE